MVKLADYIEIKKNKNKSTLVKTSWIKNMLITYFKQKKMWPWPIVFYLHKILNITHEVLLDLISLHFSNSHYRSYHLFLITPAITAFIQSSLSITLFLFFRDFKHTLSAMSPLLCFISLTLTNSPHHISRSLFKLKLSLTLKT